MRLLRRLARRGVRLSAWNHTTHHPTDASSYVSLHPAGHDSNSSSSSGPPDHGAKSDSIGGGIAGNDSLVETQRTVAMDPSRGAPGTPPPPTSRPAGLDHNQKGPLLGTSSSSSSSSSSSRTSNIGPYAALTVTTSGSNHNTSSSTATTTTTTRVVVVETVVSQLVQELASAPDTGSDQAARALRMLFAVSEYGGGDTNTTNSNRDNDTRNKNTNIKPAGGGLEDIRQAMIADGTLVPALLRFLEHCRIEKAVRDRNNNNGRSPSSSSRSVPHQNTSATTNAQVSLALLVLNNISIPVANKRRVALGTNNNSNGGMAVLCRLLGDDPSCRLVVIVLVNLTFCDATLRRDLIYTADIYLFPVLAYAFRVASLTRNEYNQRKPHLGSAASTAAAAKGWTTETSTVNNPVQRLSALLALEESLLVKTKKSFNCVTTTTPMVSSWPLPRDQMFPDTARWCVCAMQNLTRPGIDATSNPAAFALINTGIIPYLLRCIDVGGVGSLSPRRLLQGKSTALSSSSSSGTRDGTPEPSEPPDDWNHEVTNHPSKWAKETAQDATLYVVMNMVTVPSACKFLLNNEDTVSLLVGIAECGKHLNEVGCDLSVHEKQVTIFQCMKARIALAYLACSDKSLSMVRSSRLILVSKADVEQLVDVLGHTLHRRPKPHPGGFSASTFSLKYVLRAVWTILANPKNQEQFAETNMEMVNAFFIKILALHAFQKVSFVDAESAEYACHSLYLLSHYGFHVRFSISLCAVQVVSFF